MNSKLTASEGHAETKLHSAAWAGDIELASHEIETGIDINTCDSISETPLHGAAAWGRYEMVKFLLINGANPNLKNEEGNTALHWACSHGNKKTVELLVSNGAKLNNNGSGLSPLEIALNHNQEETAEWLKTKI